jgi:DNA polymerase-1
MPTKPPAGPLLIIDGDSFAHRAYHGVPKTIVRGDGRGGNAIVGFFNYVVRLWNDERPRAIVTGWDTLEAPNWRQLEFAPYQGGRDIDQALVEQLDRLPELCRACGFTVGRAAGYEADDFLATAVAREEAAGGTALVASGDRDAFQLASAATTVLHPVKAGEIARIGRAQVRERYDVEPHQVPDFIALRGDPSDKLPGARGVGEKTAASLLHRYPDLEAMLADNRFEREADALRLYRRIATMTATAPLPDISDAPPSWAEGAALAKSWGLNTLAERLGQLASG